MIQQRFASAFGAVFGVACAALLGMSLLSIPSSAGADPAPKPKPDDAAALAGLESTRSVFLINKPTAKATARYLKGIRATHASLAKQGVDPTTVLVFLGPPVQYITTAPSDAIADDDGDALESIAATTQELAKLGVRMEVCAAATNHFGVDNASLLPGMDAVGNGFISLIGWQSKGFVPMTF